MSSGAIWCCLNLVCLVFISGILVLPLFKIVFNSYYFLLSYTLLYSYVTLSRGYIKVSRWWFIFSSVLNYKSSFLFITIKGSLMPLAEFKRFVEFFFWIFCGSIYFFFLSVPEIVFLLEFLDSFFCELVLLTTVLYFEPILDF